MTQTRRMSAVETAAGTAIRFTTGLSLAQGYPIRRFFNWLNTRKDPFK